MSNQHIWLLLAGLIFLSGCDMSTLHMRDQAKFEPLEESTLFEDGLASRQLPANTIPRGEWGQIKMDEHLYTGKINGEFADTLPMPVTRELLTRGQERYNIFCAPCHSRVGDGQGMIVQRGFPPPPSFHIDRLRQEPPGYYYDVISNGFGVMYGYASRIHPNDRWAIVAYIRALQLSQNATISDVPQAERPDLMNQTEDSP